MTLFSRGIDCLLVMRRIVYRILPDGQNSLVQPFHVCLKGLENAILCKDDEDYDAMVKVICVCSKRKNVIVIIYGAVSNHCHVAVLAKSRQNADSYAKEIKRMYSMHFQKKYKVKGILRRIEIKAISLDTDQHVRNTLAYIPKNAMDNGSSVYEYPWTGFRAMFSGISDPEDTRPVSQLSFREKVSIMHTGDKLTGVDWLLDSQDHLLPSSFCDKEYLEQAFNHDAAFFLRLVGGVNSAQMKHELEEKPYQMQSDSEYYKTVNELCKKWFMTEIPDLSEAQKIRILPYLFRTTKTTERQLARIVGMTPMRISEVLQRNKFC